MLAGNIRRSDQGHPFRKPKPWVPLTRGASNFRSKRFLFQFDETSRHMKRPSKAEADFLFRYPERFALPTKPALDFEHPGSSPLDDIQRPDSRWSAQHLKMTLTGRSNMRRSGAFLMTAVPRSHFASGLDVREHGSKDGRSDVTHLSNGQMLVAHKVPWKSLHVSPDQD